MSLYELIHTAEYKKTQLIVWQWSKGLAILGGVFILNEWPYGDLILTIAAFILIVVYFFAGFDPLPEENDWTLVYPQLAGISDDEEDKEVESEILLERIKRHEKEIEELKKKIEDYRN